jgi:hypothetical protein
MTTTEGFLKLSISNHYRFSSVLTLVLIMNIMSHCGSPSLQYSHWSSGSTFCFLPGGGSGSRPGDAPTLTMEPGSPVSDVSLYWWFWCDLWSPATIDPLYPAIWRRLLPPAALAIPSPLPFRSLQTLLLLLATQWPVKSPVKLLRWSPVEAMQLHSNT